MAYYNFKQTIRVVLTTLFRILPSGTATWVYTTCAKIPWLRNSVNRMIIFFLPRTLSFSVGGKPITFFLNHADPVISGALMLGVYEPLEQKLFQDTLREGMTVVDIGANVGYYTVFAAAIVGPTGKVIACEPDTENIEVLTQNISCNNFSNTLICKQALSDRPGTVPLYISQNNKGDHRIYKSQDAREVVTVPVTDLDSYLASQNIEYVDVIKMDIQGAEGLALKGMLQTLARNEHLTLFVEFWPEGLRSTGEDPYSFLMTLKNNGFILSEVDEMKKLVTEITDFNHLIQRCSGRRYTNLVCQK